MRCSVCCNIRPLGDLAWWSKNSCSGFGQFAEKEAEIPEEVEKEHFVGKLPEFLILKTKRKEIDDGTVRRNNRRRRAATAKLFADKAKEVPPASWLGGESSGPQPVWASKLDASHLLFHAGGGVFCSRCGAANGRAGKGKLHSVCSGRVVAGSAWRLEGLLRGRCAAWASWPDVRAKHVRVSTSRVVGGETSLIHELNVAVAKELGDGLRAGFNLD